VPVVVDLLGDFFPELKVKKDFVMEVIKNEEAEFNKTLDKGVKYFSKTADDLIKKGVKVVPGASAFFLSSSLGFPLDLCQSMAEVRGLEVDEAGYKACMKEEKQKNKDALNKKKGGVAKDMTMQAAQTAALQAQSVAATAAGDKYLHGPAHETAAVVKAIYIGRGVQEGGAGFVDEASAADGAVGLVLDATSFYAQAGGQINDTGVLALANGAELQVVACEAYGGYVVHIGNLLKGAARVGDDLACKVDYARRTLVTVNHSMTHVLNLCLRTVLCGGAIPEGTDVCNQKGSLVDDEKLRFDFSFGRALKTEELVAVEAQAQAAIANGLEADCLTVPLADASKIKSIRMVFGERYVERTLLLLLLYYYARCCCWLLAAMPASPTTPAPVLLMLRIALTSN